MRSRSPAARSHSSGALIPPVAPAQSGYWSSSSPDLIATARAPLLKCTSGARSENAPAGVWGGDYNCRGGHVTSSRLRGRWRELTNHRLVGITSQMTTGGFQARQARTGLETLTGRQEIAAHTLRRCPKVAFPCRSAVLTGPSVLTQIESPIPQLGELADRLSRVRAHLELLLGRRIVDRRRALQVTGGIGSGRPRPGIGHRAWPRKRRVRRPRRRHGGCRIRGVGQRPGVWRKRVGFALRRKSHGLPLRSCLKRKEFPD